MALIDSPARRDIMSKRNLLYLLLITALGASVVVSGLAVARSVDLEEPTFGVEPGESRDIPETVWFQGFLADGTTGDPITATYDIVARIYDQSAGGSMVWGPEAHDATPITEGWFNIELGSSVALPAFDDPPYYLALMIDGETLDPRLKMASVPTALRSGTVDMMLPYMQILNTGDHALDIRQNGTGNCGWFEQGNALGGSALYARSVSSNPGVHARNTGNGPAFRAQADGDGPAGIFEGDVQIAGLLEGSVTDTFAAKFSSSCPGALVIRSRYTGPQDAGTAAGIYSDAYLEDGWGIGGMFGGNFAGAICEAQASPTAGGGFGLIGQCLGGEGTTANTGVWGYASGGGDNYGVVGEALGGSRQETWAGYFNGDVYADAYYAPLALMRIDHPVNPADATLSHAFIASDEMKTVYDGVVLLDGSGSAWVELPDWFEALNGDFRYQLTPIGAAAPNLHIASAIVGNRFAIGGGEAGMEVSWQVTGIRHDAVAEMRRAPVEATKLGDKRGKYMHPEAFGLPETMATDYSEERERAKEILRERFSKER
jgi:hypothetical protein